MFANLIVFIQEIICMVMLVGSMVSKLQPHSGLVEVEVYILLGNKVLKVEGI